MGTLSWVSRVGLMPSQGSLQIERGLVSESERFADGEKGLEPRFGRGQPLESGEGEKTFLSGTSRRNAICLHLTLTHKTTVESQDNKQVSGSNIV